MTTAELALPDVTRQVLDRHVGALTPVLPAGVNPERWQNLVIQAVSSSPQLAQCFETEQGQLSVLLAVVQAATIGLEPNTPRQQCWLLPRRKGNVQEAQLVIGYRGWVALLADAGVIVEARDVVRDGDHFVSRQTADGHHFEHEHGDQRGEMTHAWCRVVRWMAGREVRTTAVVDRAHVEARRAVSDSWRNEKARPYSPWTVWPEEMWLKTAVKAVVPLLSLTADVGLALTADEQTFRLSDRRDAIEATGTVAELEPAGDKPTVEQTRHLFALLKDAGLPTDQAERRRWAGAVLEREVSSFTDLTAGDVDVLIRELQATIAAQSGDPGPVEP